MCEAAAVNNCSYCIYCFPVLHVHARTKRKSRTKLYRITCGMVNVGDYVTAANYILELNPDPFIFSAADVDHNKAILFGSTFICQFSPIASWREKLVI